MFEASNLTTEDIKQLCRPGLGWQKTYYRTHASSLRPLKIWFAEGKRKDVHQVPHRTHFAYIEFRDNQGNHRFHCMELAIEGQSVAQVLSEAVNISIPLLTPEQHRGAEGIERTGV